MQLHATPAADGSYARFNHDCARCKFLGQHGLDDLYFCSGDIETTVIARRSSDGPDYSSGMAFSYGSIPSLTEARKRAQAQGLSSFDLKSALHSMNPLTADDECWREMRDELAKSDIGDILAMFATDAPAATKRLREHIEAAAQVFLARFPATDIEDLRSWARTPVFHAREWAERMGLSHPSLAVVVSAAYVD